MLYTDPSFTSTPLFKALYEASGSQEFTKNLDLSKIKAVSGRKLLDSTALNTPESEIINLLDNFQKCSAAVVL